MSPDPLNLAAAEQARTVVLQMMAERGRGVVLVGAARLDLALEHLLKAVMAPSQHPDDGLFTPDRSLGSFGSKISLASRLGLIESPVERALHAIRSVRNDFAHSAGDSSLREARHQKRLRRVYSEAQANPLWPSAGTTAQPAGAPQRRCAAVRAVGHGAGGLHRILRPPPGTVPAPRHGAVFWGLNGPEAL